MGDQRATPTQRPERLARDGPAWMHERAVVTVTSLAGDSTTAASSSSTANRIPIGPIVGGIVAGVAVVCLIGGTWWYCAMKKEKEREARRRRKARQRAGTGASRPSIATRPSATSLASMGKPGAGMRHDEKVPPVPAIPASAYTMPYVPPAQGYGGQSQYQHQQQQHQQPYNQHPNNYQYQQPQYQGYQPQQAYSQPQQTMQQGPPVLAPPIDVSSPSPSSETSSSNEKPSRSGKSRMRNLREVPPANGDGSSKYAPAKPSPLALAGKVAREKSQADAGPQWGQGPFRSMSGDSQDGPGAGTGATEHLASPGREPTSPGTYTGQAMLSPTQSGFSAASGDVREPSGEWGKAYTASGDNRYRQPVDSHTYQSEPIRPQPARTAVQYDAFHRSPPRQGANGGSAGAQPGQAAYAYDQAMNNPAEDPYAQAALRAVSPVADPYLPASPSGRAYGRV